MQREGKFGDKRKLTDVFAVGFSAVMCYNHT